MDTYYVDSELSALICIVVDIGQIIGARLTVEAISVENISFRSFP